MHINLHFNTINVTALLGVLSNYILHYLSYIGKGKEKKRISYNNDVADYYNSVIDILYEYIILLESFRVLSTDAYLKQIKSFITKYNIVVQELDNKHHLFIRKYEEWIFVNNLQLNENINDIKKQYIEIDDINNSVAGLLSHEPIDIIKVRKCFGLYINKIKKFKKSYFAISKSVAKVFP